MAGSLTRVCQEGQPFRDHMQKLSPAGSWVTRRNNVGSFLSTLSLDMQMDGNLESSPRSKLEARMNPQSDAPCASASLLLSFGSELPQGQA